MKELTLDELYFVDGGWKPSQFLTGVAEVTESIVLGVTGQLKTGSDMFASGVNNIVDSFKTEKTSTGGTSHGGGRF